MLRQLTDCSTQPRISTFDALQVRPVPGNPSSIAAHLKQDCICKPTSRPCV